MSNIITLLCTIAACSDEHHHRLLHPQFIIFRHHTQQSDYIAVLNIVWSGGLLVLSSFQQYDGKKLPFYVSLFRSNDTAGAEI